MRCGKCGSDNREGRKFCAKCGASLARSCPKCGASSNEPGEDFCGECGASLATPSSRPAVEPITEGSVRIAESSSAALEGERKTVTVLFADIKGSMDMIEDLDPEEARAIVDPALKLMIDAAQRYGGYVAQSTGDGIFALFGAPVAYEDHPQRTLYAALRMQEELKRYSDRIRAEGRLPVQVRVGVNTGEVVVRTIQTGDAHTEYVPIGHATSLASRMQALAPIGSIAATEAVRKRCEGYFTFRGLGPTKVKGVSAPVEVYEVTGLGPLRTRLQRAAGRGLTKFVGREREMEALKHAAELARGGRGQIVAAMAEPGVGKSRLFHEFKARNQSGWMLLEAPSFSHGKASAYLPVIDLLHSYFRITADDDQRTRREKINGRIVTLDLALEDTRPYLFALLGLDEGDNLLGQMDVQTRRRRTLEAIKRVILRESLNQPLMLIFEDLHWIDDETQALLNLLADSIGTSRVLLLANYRPEYSHPWGSKTYYTQLRLDPLGTDNAEEMLTTLLGSDAELAPLKRLMAEKTEGNPLFMEEIYLSLLEDGTLARNGGVKLIKPLASLRIPPRVEGILASRIDRLPAENKELFRTLAVIGTDFQLCIARALSGKADDELREMLNDRQLAEFIYEQPAMGDLEYTFKHALTREVAYRSLLNERRRVLHDRAGEAIEVLFSDHLDDHLAELAHHFTQSANAPKATRYLTLVGKQALERSTFTESQAQLQKGLEWVKQVPDAIERAKLELELLLSSEETLRYARGVGGPEAAGVMRRADELCEQVGTDAQRFSVLIGMREVLIASGDYESAIEKCRLALELAQRTNEPEMLQSAAGFSALTLYQGGRLVEGLQQARRAIELTRFTKGKRSFLSLRAEWIAMSAAANSLLLLGYPEQAEKTAREALTRARQITHPTALLAAQSILFVYLSLGMPKVAREFAEEAVLAAERSGFTYLSALWRGRMGSAIAKEGNPQEGVGMIRSALKQSSPDLMGASPASALRDSLIEALSLAGRYDEAIAEADALLANQSNLARLYLGYTYFLKGEAICGRDASAADAEACFGKAIEITKGQSAKWWELRATNSLARLLAKQSKRDEARAMLTEIYDWFTEGFDTADLKDAKALLAELGG